MKRWASELRSSSRTRNGPRICLRDIGGWLNVPRHARRKRVSDPGQSRKTRKEPKQRRRDAGSERHSFSLLDERASGKAVSNHKRPGGDIDLPGRTGAKLIAMVRDDDLRTNLKEDLCVKEGDTLVLFGRHAQLDQSIKILRSGPPEKQPGKTSLR